MQFPRHLDKYKKVKFLTLCSAGLREWYEHEFERW